MIGAQVAGRLDSGTPQQTVGMAVLVAERRSVPQVAGGEVPDVQWRRTTREHLLAAARIRSLAALLRSSGVRCPPASSSRRTNGASNPLLPEAPPVRPHDNVPSFLT